MSESQIIATVVFAAGTMMFLWVLGVLIARDRCDQKVERRPDVLFESRPV